MGDDVIVPYDTTGEAPRTGGVLGFFRRWGAGKGGAAISFSMVEELFGPSRQRARLQVQEQRQAARPAPAPADPTELPGPDR